MSLMSLDSLVPRLPSVCAVMSPCVQGEPGNEASLLYGAA